MKPINLLITNDLVAYSREYLSKADMVISVSNDGKFFTIAKNRYGFISTDNPRLPISILPKVIAKPDGQLVLEFEWK